MSDGNEREKSEFAKFLEANAEQVERQWHEQMADSVLTALSEGEYESRQHKNASVTMYAQRDAVMNLIANRMAGFRKDAVDATKELAALRAELAEKTAEVERVKKPIVIDHERIRITAEEEAEKRHRLGDSGRRDSSAYEASILAKRKEYRELRIRELTLKAESDVLRQQLAEANDKADTIANTERLLKRFDLSSISFLWNSAKGAFQCDANDDDREPEDVIYVPTLLEGMQRFSEFLKGAK